MTLTDAYCRINRARGMEVGGIYLKQRVYLNNSREKPIVLKLNVFLKSMELMKKAKFESSHRGKLRSFTLVLF